jgi:hypothetical protein
MKESVTLDYLIRGEISLNEEMELKTVKIKGKFTSIYLKNNKFGDLCKIRRNFSPYLPLSKRASAE